MKLGKSLALMALGAGAVVVYQKYSKPIMKSMKKEFEKISDDACKCLEDMM